MLTLYYDVLVLHFWTFAGHALGVLTMAKQSWQFVWQSTWHSSNPNEAGKNPGTTPSCLPYRLQNQRGAFDMFQNLSEENIIPLFVAYVLCINIFSEINEIQCIFFPYR